MPIYIANRLSHDPSAFEDYCMNIKGMTNVKILVPKIKKNTLMLINGFEMRIRGEGGSGGVNLYFKANKQLHLDRESLEVVRRIEKYIEKNKEYKINESVNKLYDILLDKLKGPYKYRPSNPISKIEASRDAFCNEIEMEKKVVVIYEMLNLFRCDIANSADLSIIGGSKNSGVLAIKKNTVSKNEVELINQSITGLFENRIKI